MALPLLIYPLPPSSVGGEKHALLRCNKNLSWFELPAPPGAGLALGVWRGIYPAPQQPPGVWSGFLPFWLMPFLQFPVEPRLFGSLLCSVCFVLSCLVFHLAIARGKVIPFRFELPGYPLGHSPGKVCVLPLTTLLQWHCGTG